MAQPATLHQLTLLVQKLAERQGGRELILIDGYPAAGKTTFAAELSALQRVAWTPVDAFMTDDRIDARRIRKDLIRPFRREGKVREVVPSMSGSGLQRGRPLSGIRVLILEGLGVSELARTLRADQVWWMDCAADIRAKRMSGDATGIPGASFSDIKHKLIQAEAGDLRAKTLKIADIIVSTDDEPMPRLGGPSTAEPAANLDLGPESVAAALGSTSALLDELSGNRDDAVDDTDDLHDDDVEDDDLLPKRRRAHVDGVDRPIPGAPRDMPVLKLQPKGEPKKRSAKWAKDAGERPIPGAPRDLPATAGNAVPGSGGPPIDLGGFILDADDDLDDVDTDVDQLDGIDEEPSFLDDVDAYDAGGLDEDAGDRDPLADLLPSPALNDDRIDDLSDNELIDDDLIVGDSGDDDLLDAEFSDRTPIDDADLDDAAGFDGPTDLDEAADFDEAADADQTTDLDEPADRGPSPDGDDAFDAGLLPASVLSTDRDEPIGDLMPGWLDD